MELNIENEKINCPECIQMRDYMIEWKWPEFCPMCGKLTEKLKEN